jgi:DNA-binding GntR family transcriptional regulator
MSQAGQINALPARPSLVEQVYDAIVDEICTGRLTSGTPLRQEILAKRFDVSRQPVQQALLMLRRQGLVREFGRRGLEVTPISADLVNNVYDLRAVLDGYAARAAASRGLTAGALEHGRQMIQAGREAHTERAFARMVTEDAKFHQFLVDEAGNPLLIDSASVIWRNVQRVMSEVLLRGGSPRWVWDEHAAILEAVAAGDGLLSEVLARQHAEHGKHLILDGLDSAAAPTAPSKP